MLTHSSVCMEVTPQLHLNLDGRRIAVLLAKRNLYGFTGCVKKQVISYGNDYLSEMWEHLRNYLPLFCLHQWRYAFRKERSSFPNPSLQLLFK